MSATHNWRWAIKADEEAAPKGKVTTETREAEQISGSLFRGKGGKFQGGPGTILINRMEAIRAKRQAKKQPAAPPQGADAINAFLGGLGLDPKLSDALSEYLSGLAADPPEEMALNKDAALALQAQGLIKIRPGQKDAGSLSIDLTSAGSRLGKAVAKGDIAAGMKVIEKGNERAATRAEKDKAKADKAAAVGEKDKAAAAETKPAEKPKGGGGGGGGSAKPEEKEEETAKPTAEEKAAAKREAKIAKANELGAEVGLKEDTIAALREAADNGSTGQSMSVIRDLEISGFTSDGEITDAGRTALNALERGDIRGYRNALQNGKAKLEREKARGDKVRERADKQKARDEEKVKKEADRTAKEEQRTQERTAKQQARDDAKKKRDEDRAKAKTDKASAKDAEAKKQLQKLAGDFRKGRRGLSLDQQDQLVEAGLGSVDDKGRFALKALSWRWAN